MEFGDDEQLAMNSKHAIGDCQLGRSFSPFFQDQSIDKSFPSLIDVNQAQKRLLFSFFSVDSKVKMYILGENLTQFDVISEMREKQRKYL